MSAENTEEVEAQTGRKMDTTLENLKRELGGIHAGRVSPSMLDSVKVDYYGNPSPISQVANISTPEPQTLAINHWEKKMIKDIEHSLQAANLGFSISNDGNLIRLIMSPFTEERRKEYVKQVKKIGEDAKIAVRNVRREGNDLLKKLEKEKASQTNIQQVTDEHISIIDDLIGTKEKELMSL